MLDIRKRCLCFAVFATTLVTSVSGDEGAGGQCDKYSFCPNHACCSQYGYCGWTDEFCGEGCQSKCNAKISPPRCHVSHRMTVSMGYYSAFAESRDCQPIAINEINATGYTHMAYAFAGISEAGYIDTIDGDNDEYYRYQEFNALKTNYTGLKTLISVGGAAFDPDTFSYASSTESYRQRFAWSVVKFLEKYDFDGIDLDWEYPSSYSDFINYVLLVKELRTVLNSVSKNYLITVAAPIGSSKLQYFDVAGISDYIDWFNIMSYDIHSSTDSSGVVEPHTDVGEIEDGLKIFWLNNVNPSKMVLGVAAYGRTYTLADNDCVEIGCEFADAGDAGCTGEEGILPFFEIYDIVKGGSFDTMVYDEASGSMYMVVNGDQWVAFDYADTVHDYANTYAVKNAFARKHCLRGTVVWSLDMLVPAAAETVAWFSPAKERKRTVVEIILIIGSTVFVGLMVCCVCFPIYAERYKRAIAMRTPPPLVSTTSQARAGMTQSGSTGQSTFRRLQECMNKGSPEGDKGNEHTDTIDVKEKPKIGEDYVMM